MEIGPETPRCLIKEAQVCISPADRKVNAFLAKGPSVELTDCSLAEGV